MGNLIEKTMDESFQRNKKFMIEMQTIQLDRQIHMREQLRMRSQALQLARARELFFWWAAFSGISLVGAIAAARRTKSRTPLAPLLPLAFILGYQADLAYGTKISRIRAEADSIMQCEEELIESPGGIPTASIIDAARNRFEDEKRYTTKVHDMYV